MSDSAVENAENSVKEIFWKGEAGIEQAESARNELLEAFKSAKEVHLDISEVDDLDISAIQLILSSYKESEKTGIPFSVVGKLPEVIDNFCKQCGIPLSDFNSKAAK